MPGLGRKIILSLAFAALVYLGLTLYADAPKLAQAKNDADLAQTLLFAGANIKAATRIGAYEEIVEHGKSGWLVPPADPQALANAIRMLWNDPTLRQQLSEGGRRRIVEKFNWRKAAEETLAVYEEIVPRRPRP